ncbi:dihydrofolate reductase family protein [Levilactobacillus brevis]|uniref:dihydrofolate reductase family protein n=1 Tax=Levilactobacillus brevis TaxID=1580 RepID=UPI001BAE3C90|nr:dihydrofolate reductase family protein [Levilactobacillus brevis]MBS0947951.1 dihydrofolate reductase [Levilactobacillus brevis]
MGKIQFYGAISLDGYLATTDDRLDWLTGLAGIPVDAGHDVLGKMTTAIMGRVTYDTIAESASTLTLNPYNPTMHSYVLTQRPYQDTATITFTSEDLLGLARRLKQQSGNVWIIGGQTILTPLIADDLIDELYLQIAPVTLGQGKRLFGDLNRRHHFHLQSVHPLGPLAELVYEKGEN